MCPWFDSWRNHLEKPPVKRWFSFQNCFKIKFAGSNNYYYFCTTSKKKQKLNGFLAQLVEQWIENPCVPGSIPGETT
jgi:hypothetical protein